MTFPSPNQQQQSTEVTNTVLLIITDNGAASKKSVHRHTICSYADLQVNVSELPSPQNIVEKLSMVEAIVIRAVALRMVRRSENCHFVTID